MDKIGYCDNVFNIIDKRNVIYILFDNILFDNTFIGVIYP